MAAKADRSQDHREDMPRPEECQNPREPAKGTCWSASWEIRDVKFRVHSR